MYPILHSTLVITIVNIQESLLLLDFSLFSGVIYAFNLKVSNKVQKLASESGVEIRHHNIIYKLFDDIKVGLTFSETRTTMV